MGGRGWCPFGTDERLDVCSWLAQCSWLQCYALIRPDRQTTQTEEEENNIGETQKKVESPRMFCWNGGAAPAVEEFQPFTGSGTLTQDQRVWRTGL